MTSTQTYIFGTHALVSALTYAPGMVKKIFLADRAREDTELMQAIRKADIRPTRLDLKHLPVGVESDAVHQGVIGLLAVDELVKPYKEFIATLTPDANTALVILGEVQDPQNVGAVIRSAAAFGIAGVLIPEHNQAPVNGTVVKVSAGMAFQVPLVSIGNVNTTVRDLKERGFWVYGLAGEGANSIHTEVFDRPTVFILGNEANGIREKTRELCDILLSIPMHPRCESLNAAASTAVALYAWSAQHHEAITPL